MYNQILRIAIGIVCFLTILFLVKCYHVIYRIFFDPLRSFPGPKLWAASKVPQVYSETSGNIVYDLLALHQKYGSIVRIGPNDLSFTSEGVWRDVFSYRMGHEEFSKVHIPPAMNGKYGILSANRQDHARFRKVMSSSFSDKAIRDQQPIIQEYVDSLIESLRDQSDKEPQNIVQFLNWTTFDIIGKLALGESFGSLEKGQNHPWVSAIFKAVKIIVVVNGIKQLGFGSLLNYLMPLNANEARRLNWKLVSERVESRMQRGTNEGDFWDPILKRLQDEKLVSMSVEEMKCNASQLVLAGSETTATLLSGCLFYLLCNPSWIEKVTAEVRSSFQDSHDIDLFSVSSLKYMEAVLEESMRIYPPVPAQTVRIVPLGGDTIDNQFVPAGTNIHFRQYVANHMSTNFTKPEEFHPERFLGDESFSSDNLAVLRPFSAGNRNCIGQNLANAEMRLILSKLLWNFDFELDDRSKDWTKHQKVYILWDKLPLWIKVKTPKARLNNQA